MIPWEDDLLGYKSFGMTFANLVRTIDKPKVISIEAGFGRGKTFFRKSWSEQMRQEGEVVIEIDAQQSDHSDDPVVSLLGALIEALPQTKEEMGKNRLSIAKKYGAIGVKAATRIVLRAAADELIEAVTETAADKLDNFDVLGDVITELGEEMSKAAGHIIATQMAAERVRKDELPNQLEALQASLCKDSKYERVVVVIDELDRCHPDYAIAVLEAMKLVFNKKGFVFCLMVNADYLENLAQHRFGTSINDELYLDKFVDIRLRLQPREDNFRKAVVSLALQLPLAIPFGETEHFSVNEAAILAGQLSIRSGMSMRKIKRILLKVELALRCYADHPLDASMLVFLAFQDHMSEDNASEIFPRSTLTPESGVQQLLRFETLSGTMTSRRHLEGQLFQKIHDQYPELSQLPLDRYRVTDHEQCKDWDKVYKRLASYYIPHHRDALNAVAEILVPDV